MRLLLDTHALLWWLFAVPQLGPGALAAIGDPESDVYVSALTAAEIEIKRAVGKLAVPPDLREQMERNGFTELPFTIRHGGALRDLPLHHRDPFDSMLVAQARVEGLTIVTADKAITPYDVAILPATE
ncbi:type II toxin-antitoxin system VapC family toxin [Pseudonocardia yunnanensis]|uniref:Type II toxin-antitoxin system VapC family toxin n=1 Tax=Pseudonocardia yunnanensis TaxID=58107 RepID=A0ABW4EP67_9PSEU